MVQNVEDPGGAEENKLPNGAEEKSRPADTGFSSSTDPGNKERFGDVRGTQWEVNPDKPHIPDGGYGWFVVLGCFLAHVIIGGFERNEGVYYLQFKERYGRSAQLTAWPGAIGSTLMLFLGPVAGAMCNVSSVRLTVMVGSVIVTVAQFLCAFTPSFYFLFFSHGALQGVGRSFMYAPSLIILGVYFDKHLSLAAGLGSSGVGVGTFCIVPLTQHMFEQYGFVGTFIIMAGIALNGAVVAMLFRPISMHNRFTRKNRLKDPDKDLADDGGGKAQLTEATDIPSSVPKCLPSQNSRPNEKYETKYLSQHDKPDPGQQINTHDGCFMSSVKIFCPVESQKKSGGFTRKSFNFRLLKDPSFLMFCMSIGLFTSATKTGFTFIPALVKSRNIPESDAALVLSISGVFDTLGRIVSGFILDKSALKSSRPIIYNFVIFMVALVSFILPFWGNFTSMAIISALYGMLTGVYISQKSVVLVDILGIENMAHSFGLLICFQAFGTCFGPPFAGALRDYFGGYDQTFYFGGLFLVIAGLLMVASNIFLRNKRHRQN